MVSERLLRLVNAATFWPSWKLLPVAVLAIGIYSLLGLPYGFQSRFLKWQPVGDRPLQTAFHILRLFLIPALVEETIFRVLLLPHPTEAVAGRQLLGWAAVSIGLYVLSHWLLGKLLRRKVQDTLCDRRFLLMVTWLGVVLTAAYQWMGSLWLVVLIHGTVVVVWIYCLGGHEQLRV